MLYVMKKGATKNDNAFGLFAGKINSGARLENVSISGELQISSGINPSVSYQIGLICANQVETGLDYSNLKCTVINESENRYIEANVSNDANGTVEITFFDGQPSGENN